MKTVAVIPARFRSSRFPGKPLVPLQGRPMILHVADRVSQALGREDTYVATDSTEIRQVVEEAGFQAIMTSEGPVTGTDRVWEAARQLDAEVYLNVQGDEPMVDPGDIQQIAGAKEKHPGFVINGMCPLGPGEDPASVHIPKVITNERNHLLYMSRLPVPGFKSPAHRPVLMVETRGSSLAVDIPEDVPRVEEALRRSGR